MPRQSAAFDPQIAQSLHQTLIANLRRERLLDDPAIAAAFQAIPRHLFLPNHPLEEVYADKAIAVKRDGSMWVSSSSQPAMMALMLAQLGLAPGHRVLEVGTGTGYNAALMAYIVGKQGKVISLEIDADLVEEARTHLAAAGCDTVEVRCADGALGAPDAAPFDRIIVTVAAWDLLPAWREQLAPGGRIVAPLTILPGLMLSLGLECRGEYWEAVSALPCGFLPMRGVEAHPTSTGEPPRIVMYPHAKRSETTRIAMIADKAWNRIELTWNGPAPQG